MTLREEWRPVVGYEGYYEVSNLGGVRSLDRIIESSSGQRYPMRGRVKKHTISRGYPIVRLSRACDRENMFVHRLVAFAFLGSPEPGQEVCHIDGNKGNPRVDNLYWGTRADNLADSHMQAQCSSGNCPQAHG